MEDINTGTWPFRFGESQELGVLRDSDPSGTALSRISIETRPLVRGRYKITNSQLSKENFKEKEKLVAGPRWVPDIKTDWPTDCR
jgi:hypothetical protein